MDAIIYFSKVFINDFSLEAIYSFIFVLQQAEQERQLWSTFYRLHEWTGKIIW